MAEATEQQPAAAAQSPQPVSSAGEATAPAPDTTTTSATSATAAENDPFVATPPDGSSDAGEASAPPQPERTTAAAEPSGAPDAAAADADAAPPATPTKDAEQAQRGDGENAAAEWGGKDDFPPRAPSHAEAVAADKGKGVQQAADEDKSWKAQEEKEGKQQQQQQQQEPWHVEQHDEPVSSTKKGKSSEGSGVKASLPTGAFGHIYITDALKSSDGGTSTFIVYCISLPALGLTSKRRYSEFEALRAALAALHPTRIVPPLPPKHTLGDYAAKQAKAKEDATIIARRRRMLGSFLERCAKDPVLGKDEVLKRFCDGRESWVSPLPLLSSHYLSTANPLSRSTTSAPPLRSPTCPSRTCAHRRAHRQTRTPRQRTRHCPSPRQPRRCACPTRASPTRRPLRTAGHSMWEAAWRRQTGEWPDDGLVSGCEECRHKSALLM